MTGSGKRIITDEFKREAVRIEAELTALPPSDNVIEMLPDLAELYSRRIAALADALNDPTVKPEATTVIRQLVQKTLMTPDPEAADGLRMEVHGALGEILTLAAGNGPQCKLPDLVGPGCFSIFGCGGALPTLANISWHDQGLCLCRTEATPVLSKDRLSRFRALMAFWDPQTALAWLRSFRVSVTTGSCGP
ncbi:MAG TPA: hypothetical protein HPP80_07935 [Rhodospirillaceae bacterium]|nr:hypothetical protein [Rhodospirillaceae bacterium]